MTKEHQGAGFEDSDQGLTSIKSLQIFAPGHPLEQERLDSHWCWLTLWVPLGELLVQRMVSITRNSYHWGLGYGHHLPPPQVMFNFQVDRETLGLDPFFNTFVLFADDQSLELFQVLSPPFG